MPGAVLAIARLTGWRRLGVAWLAGALGALAMPPYGLLPALAVSLTVAVWLQDGAAADRTTLRRFWPCFLIGWAWGFGYLTAGLWWLGQAFLVEADEFLWALPLGVIGLPFVLGLFYGAGFGAAGLLWGRGAVRGSPPSPSGSARRTGCAATCSRGFPGTPSGWLWPRTSG